MPERDRYAPGTPSWVDLGSPDKEATKGFYGELFGWSAFSPGPDEETGGYEMLQLRGRDVAGLGPQQSPGPPFWTTYVSVTSADETAAKVKESGGQVVMDPMDVLTAGRMAIFQDPAGAFFSVWQAGDHAGCGLVNEPGAVCWNELQTRDLDGAKRFYGSVFGWSCETQQMGPMTYTEVKLASGEMVAGMVEMPPEVPDVVPDNWLVYFATDDCDATVARAQELGGTVTVPATDIPPGRFAVVADPQGAVFAVIKLSQQLVA